MLLFGRLGAVGGALPSGQWGVLAHSKKKHHILGLDIPYRRLPFWLVAVIAERSTSRRRRANLLITQARRSKGYQEGDITHLLAAALFV